METLLWGVLLGVAAIIALMVAAYRQLFQDPDRRDAFWQAVFPRLVTKPAEVEIVSEEPVEEVPPPEPDYGNIRPVLDEAQDLTEFGPEIHEFPEQKQATTRFEDFNRRLFVYAPAYKRDKAWPDTTDDDFPTVIPGLSATELFAEVEKRLRPRYPVIIDTYGWWAAASAKLEHDPDYTDAICQAYLAIAEDVRPVVISRRPGLEAGSLTFMRYGFKDWTLDAFALRFHYRACLTLVIDRLIGDREGWLWLSIARMRQTVIREVQAQAEESARQQASENARYLAEEIQRKREEAAGSRWRRLWDVRAELPQLTAETEAAEPETAAAEAPELEDEPA